MNRDLVLIVLEKCNEREKAGYDTLTDSDVMDILEECERIGVNATRQDLKELGID